MSVEPTGLPAGLAATGSANAPSWVRKGSAAVQRDYALGLQFEAMLARQLASTMAETAGLGEQQGGEEESGGASSPGGAGGGPYSSLITGAMAEGVAGGGLGLAAEIARELQSRTGSAPASAGAVPGAATNGPSAAATPSGGTAATPAAGTGGTAA